MSNGHVPDGADPESYASAKAQTSGTSTTSAEGMNEPFVSDAKKEFEVPQVDRRIPDVLENYIWPEKHSQIFQLANQRHVPNSGFYHVAARADPVTFFELQHMHDRDSNTNFQHPYQKYGATKRLLFDKIRRQNPSYENCHVRSTFDDDLLQKTSECATATTVIGRLGAIQGTRTELQNALLHYFLGRGLSEEEVDDLVREEAHESFDSVRRNRINGQHIYTFKPNLGFLTANC